MAVKAEPFGREIIPGVLATHAPVIAIQFFIASCATVAAFSQANV
jgi:hypothetical protein